jgi:tRNA A37 threonylcarbamoyltransferase TsaD
LAKKGDPTKFDLPKPIINKGGCNLSFAGLKTAILRIAKNIKDEKSRARGQRLHSHIPTKPTTDVETDEGFQRSH